MASCDTISLTQPSAFTSCACTSVSLPLRPPPFRATPKPTWARAKSLYSKHTVIPINFPDIAAIDVRQIQKSASVVVLGKLMGSSPVTVAWKHGLELERESLGAGGPLYPCSLRPLFCRYGADGFGVVVISRQFRPGPDRRRQCPSSALHTCVSDWSIPPLASR